MVEYVGPSVLSVVFYEFEECCVAREVSFVDAPISVHPMSVDAPVAFHGVIMDGSAGVFFLAVVDGLMFDAEFSQEGVTGPFIGVDGDQIAEQCDDGEQECSEASGVGVG